jgi:hypothetical protein
MQADANQNQKNSVKLRHQTMFCGELGDKQNFAEVFSGVAATAYIVHLGRRRHAHSRRHGKITSLDFGKTRSLVKDPFLFVNA